VYIFGISLFYKDSELDILVSTRRGRSVSRSGRVRPVNNRYALVTGFLIRSERSRCLLQGEKVADVAGILISPARLTDEASEYWIHLFIMNCGLCPHEKLATLARDALAAQARNACRSRSIYTARGRYAICCASRRAGKMQ